MLTASEEQQTCVRYAQFVREHSNCFERSNLHGHVTGSCFLVHLPTNEVLLTHHKKIGGWLQLGGHADGDADVLRVALREAEEESGILGVTALSPHIFDLDIHAIAEHKGVPAHFHYDLRFLLAAPHKNYIVSDESHNLKWIDIEMLATDASMSPSIRRMATKWLSLSTQF